LRLAILIVVGESSGGGGVLLGPPTDGLQQWSDVGARLGERVFDAGRYFRVSGSRHQAALLKIAQGLSEHFVADSADFALQVRRACDPFGECVDDQNAPPLGYQSEQLT
jgi:hypothetical protein